MYIYIYRLLYTSGFPKKEIPQNNEFQYLDGQMV